MEISLMLQRAINNLCALGLVTAITACGGGGGGSTSANTTISSTSVSSSLSSVKSSASISSPSSSIKSLSSVSRSSSSVKSSSSSSTAVSTVNDGTGAAAKFNNPAFIIREGGNLYLTEQLNHTVRKIVIATGAVTTLAGTAGANGSTNGTGAAARFNSPNGITSDGTNLYVVDSANHTIRKIVIATGAVTTIAGAAGRADTNDGTGAAASFFFPTGITNDGTNLYVTSAGTVRKIVIATGSVTTFAGDKNNMQGNVDGTGAAASFFSPSGITTDGTNLYVSDSFAHTIRKIVIATREVTTLAGTVLFSGGADGATSAATFNSPSDITADGANLYVADGSKTIRKINLTTAMVSTLAGTTHMIGSTDATGAAARFNIPYGITTDNTNLYVTDIFNNTVRKIVIATGAVTTLAGTAGVTGGAQ